MSYFKHKLLTIAFTLCLGCGMAFAHPTPIQAETTDTVEEAPPMYDALSEAEDTVEDAPDVIESSTETTETKQTTVSATTAAKKTTTTTVTIKKSSAQQKKDNLKRWYNVCNNMLKKLRKYHFHYGYSAGSTFKNALKNGRKCNCAAYVSWCLQEYGAISKGGTFYSNHGSIRKKGFSFDKTKVKVIKVNKGVSRAHLKPGDVVCWRSFSHVCVYGGKDKSGRNLWYEGGKNATNGSRRYVATKKRRSSYNDRQTVGYIIRIIGLP